MGSIASSLACADTLTGHSTVYSQAWMLLCAYTPFPCKTSVPVRAKTLICSPVFQCFFIFMLQTLPSFVQVPGQLIVQNTISPWARVSSTARVAASGEILTHRHTTSSTSYRCLNPFHRPLWSTAGFSSTASLKARQGTQFLRVSGGGRPVRCDDETVLGTTSLCPTVSMLKYEVRSTLYESTTSIFSKSSHSGNLFRYSAVSPPIPPSAGLHLA